MNVIQKIEDQIEALEKQKAAIQAKCSHPVNESRYHADEDEYGATQGPGGYSNTCLLCGAHWGSAKKPPGVDD